MRLIDAEILTDYFAEHDLAFEHAIKHQDRKKLERLIAEIPTAYDPDKVVKQLETYSNADEAEQLGTIPVVELADAIEIVKGGGIDGKEQGK